MPREHEHKVAEAIEADHVFVKKAIGWLRHSHEESALRALLHDLAEYLPVHFAQEEKPGGFFDSVLHTAPRYERAVETLRREHAEMLHEAHSFLAELAEEPRRASKEHIERAKAFAKALEDHEHREEGLLLDALDRDTQGGN